MKLKKVAIILTILLLSINTICFADVVTEQFNPGQPSQSDYERVFELGSVIAEGLTTVGTVIAVVGIVIIGIKYMMGSVEQKAEYKKTMIPYLVGCVFLFAISRIVSIIYSLVIQM